MSAINCYSWKTLCMKTREEFNNPIVKKNLIKDFIHDSKRHNGGNHGNGKVPLKVLCQMK